MKSGSRRTILVAMAAVVVCSLSIALASGQAVPEPKPQMAEDVFKNVLVLKGIPVDEFMDTMGMISASLNLTCSACHTEQSLDSWDKYADDTPRKQTTRRMILMVNAINKNNFGGARILTCYTCHRGDPHPKFIPSLAVQYGAPTEDPNEVFDVPGQFTPPDAPSADQIFDKYLEALGGAQRVANLTSFAAKGTYEGYDTEHEKVPMEVFAKAPAQRTTIVHMPYFGKTEDSVRTYDGRAGWIAAPDKPVTLIPLTGGSLEGAKIEAILSFPARARQAFSQWRVSSTTIDDRDVWIVQGTNAGQPPVKFYFNQESGLLMRLVRYSDSPIGRVPTQIDYDDYRAVSGVKMPFRWTTTWTGGQTIIELGELQANVPIDAAKFARPAPAPKH